MSKILCRLIGLFAFCIIPNSHAAEPPEGAERTAAWNSDLSEYPADDSIIYGKLANGLTYAIKPNDRPQNEILLRMSIDFGSAAEADDEQGLAHFIEHMAFNGSTNVPEGEMVKILERLGLSFGADTNASTGYTQTQYMLNIPNLKSETLDQALFLMRETASEISFNPDAVDRERGIIIEEKRSRENFSAQSGRAITELFYPNTYFTNRYPIGTEEILLNAPAQRLKDLYKRFYTPDRTKLVIVGPVDPIKIEKMIVEKFGSWQGESRSLGDFDVCKIDTGRKAEVKIFSHPNVTEGLAVEQFIADRNRTEGIDRSIFQIKIAIANAIISNRIRRELRNIDTPILGAGLRFSYNICNDNISIGYGVSGKDGSRDAMIPFVQKHINSALAFGFQTNEVDEIINAIENQTQNAIKSEATRQSAGFAAALSGQTENIISTSEQNLIRWLQIKQFLQAKEIHAEFKYWFSQLQEPLIFLTTKAINQSPSNIIDAQNDEASTNEDEVLSPVEFTGIQSDQTDIVNASDSNAINEISEEELKANLINAFRKSLNEPAEPIEEKEDVIFAYTDFGATGKIASDSQIEDLGIRIITFENGVKLNIKTTEFEDNRVQYSVRIDGGEFHFGKENAILSGFMNRVFSAGALGKHDVDDLRSIRLGTTVSTNFNSSTDYFGDYGSVAPDDLLLQLQILAAYTIDPGYREEAIRLFRRPLAESFARRDSTPGGAIGTIRNNIMTDDDPRFILQDQSEWEALDFDRLRDALGDALTQNPLEIGVVGDISEQAAIDAVAATFGALPARKTTAINYEDQKIATWSNNRGTHDVTHKGETDQLSWQRIWTTTDDSDQRHEQVMGLLSEIIGLKLTEELREKLGATYGSSVRSSMSSNYRDRGTFSISTSGDIDKLDLIEETVEKIVADILKAIPSEDIFNRARAPRIESYKDWRLRNSTWIGLVDTAQSQPKWLERFNANEAIYKSIKREEIWEAAKQYLSSDDYFTFRAIPENHDNIITNTDNAGDDNIKASKSSL